MNNTKITYRYRDAGNHIKSHAVVLSGVMTEAQIQDIISSLDEARYFIPGQVGLMDLQVYLQTYDETDNRDESGDYDPFGDDGSDHVWHELEHSGFDSTNEDPTSQLTAAQLVLAFKVAGDSWDELGAKKRLSKELVTRRSPS